MTFSDSKLASLALTHVYYDPSDIFGLPSAVLALFPQALIVAYIVTIYNRREIETIHMFAGQLGCEALNWVLKRLIKQDRPQHRIGVGKGYGMPSSHSQFMGFFVAYGSLYIFHRFTTSRWAFIKSRIALLAAVGLAVCISRVYLAYHTVEQVVVGTVLGILTGGLWFLAFGIVKSYGFIDWLLEQEIIRFFLIKDTVMDEALQDEWKQWHSKRLASRRKTALK